MTIIVNKLLEESHKQSETNTSTYWLKQDKHRNSL